MIWHNCYDQGWQGLIAPEAFAHPAKFARGLVERIYDHLLSTGRLRRGSIVIDPFGGVGLGGLIGASKGIRWLGCELEPRFIGLAEANFAMHRRTWESAGDPLPRIVQGDSRGLSDVLGPILAEAVVSSPPFMVQQSGGGIAAHNGTNGNIKTGANCGYQNQGAASGQLAAMPAGDVDAVLSSPPYAGDSGKSDRTGDERARRRADETGFRQGLGCFKTSEAYGTEPGQLGALPAGTVDGVLSSPPYAETAVTELRNFKGSGGGVQANGTDATHVRGYGESNGQLAALPAGTVADAVVSSPPYEGSFSGEQETVEGVRESMRNRGCSEEAIAKASGHTGGLGYGSASGQLGNTTGQTFWQASRLILLQCKLLLKPGGTAVFVTKDFVRNKKRVPFSDDWRKLCEACGFRLVEWIQATLVKETVEHQLFGGPTTRRKERKSFFRRLAEKKGSPRIDHEDVLVMERL